MNVYQMYGHLKVRYRVPIYDDDHQITGQKNFYESLGGVITEDGTSIDDAKDAAQLIITAFGRLFENYSVDQTRTTITYYWNVVSLIADDSEISGNYTWQLILQNSDSIGGHYDKKIGYFMGDITREKAAQISQLGRALTGLSTNEYENVKLELTINPYEE